MVRVTALFLLLVAGERLFAAHLPRNLTPSEIGQVVQILGAGSTVRLLRSAEPYDAFPGLKIGVEVAAVPTHNLNDLGDQLGSLPGVMPVPRFYVSKGLFANLEVIVNFFPVSISNSISTLGGSLKWAFFEESENWLHGALYFSVSKVSGFDDTFSGSNVEFGGLVSKDLVTIKPYLGAGVIFAKGNVAAANAATADTGGQATLSHVFLGTEIEVPLNLALQLDVMNLNFGGTLFFGKKF